MGAPGMLPAFRASGVSGTVGAAATGAKMYGLDIATTMNALGAAACFAHGFGQGFVSGTTEVKFNVGMASRQGLSAAILARLGATASAVAFEGDVGYFRAFGRNLDHLEEATKGLGETWLIEETVYKECPICIFTQTPVALAKQIASRLDVAQVERITLTAPDLTYTNPGFLNDKPYKTHLQAAISARFCTAAALLGKPVESYELYDQLDEPEVLALAEKIELVNRPADTERLDLEVVQRNGTFRASGVEHDTLFPSKEKVIAKFRRLTGPLPVDTEKVLAVILDLENVDDIRVLTDLLRTPQ
jgi:2-methylcitrate dehydratase PrpD